MVISLASKMNQFSLDRDWGFRARIPIRIDMRGREIDATANALLVRTMMS
jgi:hypothetical protein